MLDQLNLPEAALPQPCHAFPLPWQKIGRNMGHTSQLCELSPLEQLVHKSWCGADLWQTQGSWRQNAGLSKRNYRDTGIATKRRKWLVFNLSFHSLTFSVLMDCTHTLLLQMAFKATHRENEAWHFTLMEKYLFSAVGICPLREDNRKVMLLLLFTDTLIHCHWLKLNRLLWNRHLIIAEIMQLSSLMWYEQETLPYLTTCCSSRWFNKFLNCI